ncbi:uncharacterized protein [Scyliorhinus torazame]|uniref:uncharacterized protein n=1 Tax=Scyliorhinus torazame TaxID=75743 RepID=UPI003B59697D
METPMPQYQSYFTFASDVNSDGLSDWSSIISELGCEGFTYWDCVPSESDCNGLSDWKTSSSESDSFTDSTSHSLSPASSIDSYRFSPPFVPCTPGQEAHSSSWETGSLPSLSEERLDAGQRVRKTRSRYPGRQRQNASEREKLRMRGLAKALHNLRTYLPPSVAPASQSLTKLETLRLTIRYISHLTELLNLSEEGPSEGRDTESKCQVCPRGLGWCQDKSTSAAPGCLAHPGDLIMNGDNPVPADFQDVLFCQSFTENTENLQLDSWFP